LLDEATVGRTPTEFGFRSANTGLQNVVLSVHGGKIRGEVVKKERKVKGR